MGLDSTPERPSQDLTACYAALVNRLFPDPMRPADPQDTEAVLGFLQAGMDRERESRPFDPLRDRLPVTACELAQSPTRSEFEACERAIRAAKLPLLMHLARDATPFDPEAHTVGVHNLALTVGRRAKAAGVAVDLPLLSAAAYTHDVGKFGCRGAEASRTPLLHYRYTEQWLRSAQLPQIARIAVRHAIWDLEDGALPIESKFLICADVRVRGLRENGKERVRVVSLEQAHACIREKLLDPTPEKIARYERVFARLSEFAGMLEERGVPAATLTL